MFFNTKLVLGACFAAVAFASPAKLQARDSIQDWRAMVAEYEGFSQEAPQWNGTEAGIDALDARLYRVAGYVAQVYNDIGPNGNINYYGDLRGLFQGDLLTAARAVADLYKKAKAKKSSFGNKINDAWSRQGNAYSNIFFTGLYDDLKPMFNDAYYLITRP